MKSRVSFAAEPETEKDSDTPIILPPLSCNMDNKSSESGNRRINLRKRCFYAERQEVNMSSYNSAFLSGLFADVAKATDTGVGASEQEECDEIVTADPRSDLRTTSIKRSRISLTKSLSRVGRSQSNLANLFDDQIQTETKVAPAKCSVERIDSLHLQLSCVANVSTVYKSPKSVMSVVGIGNDAFPNLPASVSDSSCSAGLTRNEDRAVSTFENSNKESYGWFVEMDDGHDHSDFVDPYSNNATSDLAFSAATAPKRNQLDDDLEWAKAADTVDDVLGDFF